MEPSLFMSLILKMEPLSKSLWLVNYHIHSSGSANDALVYITRDDTFQADKVWMHKLFSDQSTDLCIYHEDDDMFSLDIYISESKKYVFVESESPNTNYIFYLDILKPEAGLKTLTRRLYGIDSKASHRGHHFFLTRTNEKSYYSELVACPVENISDVTVLLPHKKSYEELREVAFAHAFLLKGLDMIQPASS